MQISQRMWSLWPQIIQCFYEWAVDYLDHISGALENYVCKGTDHFLAAQNPSHLQQVPSWDACVPDCLSQCGGNVYADERLHTVKMLLLYQTRLEEGLPTSIRSSVGACLGAHVQGTHVIES